MLSDADPRWCSVMNALKGEKKHLKRKQVHSSRFQLHCQHFPPSTVVGKIVRAYLWMISRLFEDEQETLQTSEDELLLHSQLLKS